MSAASSASCIRRGVWNQSGIHPRQGTQQHFHTQSLWGGLQAKLAPKTFFFFGRLTAKMVKFLKTAILSEVVFHRMLQTRGEAHALQQKSLFSKFVKQILWQGISRLCVLESSG